MFHATQFTCQPCWLKLSTTDLLHLRNQKIVVLICNVYVYVYVYVYVQYLADCNIEQTVLTIVYGFMLSVDLLIES